MNRNFYFLLICHTPFYAKPKAASCYFRLRLGSQLYTKKKQSINSDNYALKFLLM